MQGVCSLKAFPQTTQLLSLGQDRTGQVSANMTHTSHALIMEDPFKRQSLPENKSETGREGKTIQCIKKNYRHRWVCNQVSQLCIQICVHLCV